jgi:hypothetical protein
MNSFDRLLQIYPEAYTDEERAQTFLWYHLRRHPRQKTVHVKTIQDYFRKADRKVPSLGFIRSALDEAKLYPPGSTSDTFGFSPEYRSWHDDRFGSCFDESSFAERFQRWSDTWRTEHPWDYWLSVIGSVASIIGIPLAIILWLAS